LKIGAENLKFVKKWKFHQKIENFTKNRKFVQKLKIWPEIENFIKNRKFHRKFDQKKPSKLENCCRKSKIRQKMKISPKIRQKSKIPPKFAKKICKKNSTALQFLNSSALKWYTARRWKKSSWLVSPFFLYFFLLFQAHDTNTDSSTVWLKTFEFFCFPLAENFCYPHPPKSYNSLYMEMINSLCRTRTPHFDHNSLVIFV